jgi:hypothetical protein
MKRLPSIFLVIVFAQQIRAQVYIWPTNASRLMTSSFCEYRPGHFHAGIDIKTWGEEGYDVYAIDSGFIQRIRISPYGYGKAIYLRLNNGLTVVYAHLSRFRGDIESHVTNVQYAGQRYEQDLYFSPTRFPVQAGDLLGFTGSTGIGVPHLHFEVRDSQERPFNPLDLGYSVRDTRPPVIRALALVPLEYGSHVDGDFIPSIIPIQGNKEGTHIIPVWGKIGIAVSTYDQADGASNRFSPVLLQLIADDSLVFQTRYSRFNYDETYQVDLDRDFRLMKWEMGEFQNLYRQTMNTLNFYTPSRTSGVLRCCNASDGVAVLDERSHILKTGIHRLTIRVSDYRGNTRSANILIDVKPLRDVRMNRSVSIPLTLGNSSGLRYFWMNDFVRFQFQGKIPAGLTPWLSVWLNNKLQSSLPMRLSANGNWIGVMPLHASLDGLMVCQVKIAAQTMLQDTMRIFYLDQDGGTIYSSDRRLRCIIPKGALYGSCWCYVKQIEDPASGLGVYQIFPEALLLKKSIAVKFMLERNEKSLKGLGIYSIQETPHFISGSLEPITGNLAGYTRYLSGLTVMQDTIPPQINWFSPDSGAFVSQSELHIALGFVDDQSGISGEENYRVWLDDTPQIVSYDPERHRGVVEHPTLTETGVHWIRFVLRDLAGNETFKQFPIHIRTIQSKGNQ